MFLQRLKTQSAQQDPLAIFCHSSINDIQSYYYYQLLLLISTNTQLPYSTLSANSVKQTCPFRACKSNQKQPPIYFRGGQNMANMQEALLRRSSTRTTSPRSWGSGSGSTSGTGASKQTNNYISKYYMIVYIYIYIYIY